MAGSGRGLAVGALAIAFLGGLGWWLLGGGGAGGPTDGTGSLPPSASGGSEGAGPASVPSPHAAPAPPPKPAATGTVRVAVRTAEGSTIAHATVEPEGDGPPPEIPIAKREAGAEPLPLEVAAVPAGPSYRVLVGGGGRRTRIFPGVVLAKDEVRDLGTVVLEKALPATGRVLDPAGRPVAGAAVAALAEPDAKGFSILRILESFMAEPVPAGRAVTAADGTFAFETLDAGSWILVAGKPGFGASRETTVVLHPAGAARPVDIHLRKGHSVKVRAVGPKDAPLAGIAFAAASDPDRDGIPAGSLVRGTTDAAGETTLEGLPDGRVTLSARAPGGRIHVRSLDLPAAAEATVRFDGTAGLLVRVKDAAGAPVPGAEVQVILEVRSVDGGEFLTGATDAEGTARWDGLPAAGCMVIVRKEGFPPVTPAGGMGGMGGFRESLKDGETLEKEFVLRPGAVVTGVVRRRPGEVPVAGAEVTLHSVAGMFLSGGSSARTDAEGNYRLEAVPEGPASITAAAPGLAPPDARTAGRPGIPGAGEDGPFSIPPGNAEVRKDLWLEATCVVAGRVLGPDGEGFGGAVVSLGGSRNPLERMFGEGTAALPDPVLSAPDGAFRVEGVPAGKDVALTASAPGLLDGRSAPITLAPGAAAEDVEIRLGAGGVLLGRVTTADGAPVEGARVAASSRVDRPGGRRPSGVIVPGGFSLEAVTGPDGAWRIPSVPPGTAQVTVAAEGFVQAEKGDLPVTAGAEVRADVVLEPGQVIAGRVIGPDGKPVEGVRVNASTEARGAGRGPRYFNTVADGKGAFRFASLPPGSYAITAHSTRHPPWRATNVASGREDVEVRLEEPRRIAGRVQDAAGKPLPRARVTATPDGGGGEREGGNSTRTGVDGAFAFDNLPSGTYTLVARTTMGNFAPGEARVAAGTGGEVVIVCGEGLRIRGRIAAAGGGAASAVRMSVSARSAGGEHHTGRVETDGTFVIEGLLPGTYTLRATGSDRTSATATAEAGTADVALALVPATLAPGDDAGVFPAPPAPPR